MINKLSPSEFEPLVMSPCKVFCALFGSGVLTPPDVPAGGKYFWWWGGRWG